MFWKKNKKRPCCIVQPKLQFWTPTCKGRPATLRKKALLQTLISVKYIWFKYAFNKRKLFGTLISPCLHRFRRTCHQAMISDMVLFIYKMTIFWGEFDWAATQIENWSGRTSWLLEWLHSLCTYTYNNLVFSAHSKYELF